MNICPIEDPICPVCGKTKTDWECVTFFNDWIPLFCSNCEKEGDDEIKSGKRTGREGCKKGRVT